MEITKAAVAVLLGGVLAWAMTALGIPAAIPAVMVGLIIWAAVTGASRHQQEPPSSPGTDN